MAAIAALVLLSCLTWTGTAHALTVTSAKVSAGVVKVVGRGAAHANITWEGSLVDQASSTGAFSFVTSVLPSDCVGTLGDGTQTIQVVLQGCGPAGPAGAPGPVLLAAFDANGTKIGDVVSIGDNFAYARVELGQNTVVLGLNQSQFFSTDTNGPAPYFVSIGCTGQAFVVGHDNLLPINMVVSGIVYQAPPGTIGTVMTMQSVLGSGGSCTNATTSGLPFVPVAPMGDVSVFVPPFSVRAP